MKVTLVIEGDEHGPIISINVKADSATRNANAWIVGCSLQEFVSNYIIAITNLIEQELIRTGKKELTKEEMKVIGNKFKLRDMEPYFLAMNMPGPPKESTEYADK